MAEVDRFLARLFRDEERRSSPRRPNLEGATTSHRGRELADDWWTWALVMMGRARVSAIEERVMRTYYLSLGQVHVALLGLGSSVVEVGEAVPDLSDLQSWVSWRRVAAVAGLGRGARARALWGEGRGRVAEVLVLSGGAG